MQNFKPSEKNRPRRTNTLGGCKTCRRRHLKCDQMRPACLTCRAAELPCEGFFSEIRWMSPKNNLSQHQRESVEDNDGMEESGGSNERARSYLYTEQSRASMSTALATDLTSGSVDASLAEIETKSKDAKWSSTGDIVIGPEETPIDPGGRKPTISWGWCSHPECELPRRERVAYELIFPSQPPSPPGTGILSVNLYLADLLTISEPYEGSDFRGADLSKNWPEPVGYEPWLPFAIMSYEQFQLSTESNCCHKDGVVVWTGPRPGSDSFKFEVSIASELTVYLFVGSSDPSAEHQVKSLGFIKMSPFLETRSSDKERVNVQDGTGRVSVKVSYLEKEVPPLEDWDTWWVHGEFGSSGLVYVEKRDTERSYGMRTIPIVEVASGSEIADSVQHPFIAPLKFAFKSIKGLSLLSPLASGGQLFYHLQRVRRFHVDWTRCYAAELLCAIEYLHDKHIILAYLNPENILVDSFGHLSLCNPSLFSLKSKNGDRIASEMSECPSPELARNQEACRTMDWWALGVFLYEMLIGLPPFYHKNTDKRLLKIFDEAPMFSERLPSTALNILIKLLDKNPATRLGANGISEIKAHAFFHGMPWQQLAQREFTPPFKPRDAETVFWRISWDDMTYSKREVQRKVVEGQLYEKIVGGGWPRCGWLPVGWVKDGTENDASNKASSQTEDDGWELVWEPRTYQFHFKNRFTNETSPGRLSDEYSRTCLWGIQRIPPALPSAGSEPASRSPPCGKRKDALTAALYAGYGKQVFSQILGYGTDLSLDVPILLYHGQTYRYAEDIELCDTSEIRLTPLEWAVEHGRLDLVNLFLDNGADANFTIEPVQGPALLKAVRISNQKLVETLVQKTNRVSSTRALALAVELQDTVIVNALLVNGVLCDFEESDRPLPDRHDHAQFSGCNIGAPADLEEEHFIPPLVWAVGFGNAGLVRMLLAHGADANVAYHSLGGRRIGPSSGHSLTANFSCGRAIQLAMEFGHSEIVQLLLDNGADIGLAHPVWPFPPWPEPVHICEPVSRTVYVEITAGLEAAARARRTGNVNFRCD